MYKNPRHPRRAALAVVAWLLAAGGLGADEAVLPDAAVLRGKLHLTRGRLVFTAARRKVTLRLDRLDQVRLPAAPFELPRLATVHRLFLRDGSRLTGRLLGVDADEVRFRPTWAGLMAVPRDAVASVRQAPGFLTFVDEDFEGDLKSWKLSGRAGPSDKQHTSGKHSLLLSGPGQSAEYVLDRPLAAGRMGINFDDPGGSFGYRWRVEAEFADAGQTRAVRVTVAGASDTYAVEKPRPGPADFRVRRTPGWHRLRLEFGPALLVVTVDDDLLGVSRERGPGGMLRKVRLVCEGGPAKDGRTGQVYFDDFALARPAGPLRHPTADPGQDELWLAAGDQVLGKVLRADRGGIDMEAGFGKRTWGWGDVRGIFFWQRPSPVRSVEGEQATLWLRTGAGPQADRLTGRVLSLDEEQVTLRHPALGDMAVARGRVRRVRWVFHGRRLDLDPGSSHLGPKGKLLAGLFPPRAEGTSLRWSFPLSRPAGPARLRLRVAHLKGNEDGDARAWERGELRTEVLVNAKLVDYLNRHVPRASREPVPLTIALPGGVLRAGQNTLQLREVPERQTGHYEQCGVSGLVLEIPE
jgi:hypothetical protein